MEMDGVEYEDALGGLDFGLLNLNEEGKKVEAGASTGTFQVKDGVVESKEGDDTSADEAAEEDDNDLDDSPAGLEEEGRRNSIELRGDDTDDSQVVGDEQDENTADDMWKSFASAGVIELSDDELEDKETTRDLEWFASKAQEKINSGVEEAVETYKESLPEEVKYLLDNYDAGVSITDLIKADTAIMEYSTIDTEKLEDNTSLQKKLLSDHFALQGETPEDIVELVEDAEAAGLLEKQSKRALSKLTKHQKIQKDNLVKRQKEAEVENRNKYNTMLKTLKTSIDDKEEIIPGIELNDKQRKELFNGITKFDKEGKNEVMRVREANPDFDLVVAYLATSLNKGGKIDWDKLTTVATTKATKGLKDQALKGDKRASGKRGGSLKGLDVNIMRNALKNFK
jgi:hypothetical protein